MHWSRDLPQHPPTNELMTTLVQSFWRGNLTIGYATPDAPIVRRRILEGIYGNEQPKGSDANILVSDSDSELTPKVSVEEDKTTVDFRPILILASERPWSEAIVDNAAEVMSSVQWDDYPDDLKSLFKGCVVRKDDFARCCDGAGYDRPSFWFDRKASPAQLSSSRARAEATKWFQKEIKNLRQGSKDWYFKKAKEKFPGLSRRSFDAFWKELAPAEWRKSGKPQSNLKRRRD